MRRAVPRVSTRGYYDLTTGRTLKRNRYYLYPRRAFAGLVGSGELAIMIHGLRNDSRGAADKVEIARGRLAELGYRHPVVGLSYDSNTRGAHLARHARRALAAGQRIAAKNGRNLSLFVEDFRAASPGTRIRLLGHSLGSQVILSTVERLARRPGNRGAIESVHLFGASIPSGVPSSPGHSGNLGLVVAGEVVNYYSPADEVLSAAGGAGLAWPPLGLRGASGRAMPRYRDVRVVPENHRFASYAAVLESFP